MFAFLKVNVSHYVLSVGEKVSRASPKLTPLSLSCFTVKMLWCYMCIQKSQLLGALLITH